MGRGPSTAFSTCRTWASGGTLFTHILYRNGTLFPLVDPISHDLLANLAQALQCPKKVRPAGPGVQARSLDPHGLSLCPAAGFSALGRPAARANASCDLSNLESHTRLARLVSWVTAEGTRRFCRTWAILTNACTELDSQALSS